MFRKLSLLLVAVCLALVISPISAENTVTITSITPSTANNWGMVDITDLAGTGFVDGAMVTLAREGQPAIRILGTVESSTKISGLLDAMGAELGAWDVVVTTPDGQSQTLVAGITLTQPPAPTITSNTPDISENMGYSTVELAGTNFLYGAHVKLIRDGYEDLDAVSVRLESDTSIVCEFNLTGVSAGHWDVMVTNPDGQSGISNSIDIIEFEGTTDFTTVTANYYVDVVNGSNYNNGRSWGAAWKNIRHALSRVSAYDSTIAVAPGTYNRASGEYFPLNMREGVSLLGVAGPKETIIDASGGTTMVISYYNDTRYGPTTLEGFTVMGGNFYGRWGTGGGINIQGSSPIIRNCIIRDNRNTYYGGGIRCWGASPTIENCVIKDNLCTQYQSLGGGICLQSNSRATIINCAITGNQAASGGGIIFSGDYNVIPVASITNSIITGNTATYSGGGIDFNFSYAKITNCTISCNTAAFYGGGIYRWGSSPKVVNSIIWGNSASYSGSQIYGSLSVTYSDIQGGYGGVGNINADPLFLCGGKYRLTSGSPVIDMGTATGAPADDIEGDSRPQGVGVDMGADEFAVGQADGTSCDYCPDPNDPDQDGVPTSGDNCPDVYNPDQADSDGNGIGDACEEVTGCANDADGDGVCDEDDNCPADANDDQVDGDGDNIGDVCDSCPNDSNNDIDADGVCGNDDNCPVDTNANQADGDGDGSGDVCDTCTDTDGDGYGNPGYPANTCAVDNCPDTANSDQLDADGDGIGDACDTCSNDSNNDIDEDGICGDVDNCPNDANTDQADADSDGIGDVCDVCPNDPDNDIDGDGVCGDVDNCLVNANVDQVDTDADGLGNVCDACPNDPDNDIDGDGVCGDVDNCIDTSNSDQLDADGDGIGDACDTCTDTDGDGYGNPGYPVNTCAVDNCPDTANADQANNDGDAQGDVCDDDDDNDTVLDVDDNCQFTANTDQADNDGDGLGDLCDDDDDNDTVLDVDDNCQFTANTDQADNDGDGLGDLCDDDDDNDTVLDVDDNCQFTANTDQADNDGDGLGDLCDDDDDNDTVLDVDDNCQFTANTDQADNDGDGLGDLCDDDDDNDTILDVDDNCQFTANTDQADNDGDGLGDLCDDDDDNDTVLDVDDNCQFTANTDQADNDGDGLGDVCDDDDDNDTVLDVDDNCQFTANTDQTDADSDGLGDVCDTCTDTDGDGYGNPGYPVNTCAVDNCPDVANIDQLDTDGDGIGDACDTCTDTDGDGYGNPGFPVNTCAVDNCPDTANPDQADVDGDGIGDVCDPCDDRPATGILVPSEVELWPPNHTMHSVTIDASAIVTHNPDAQMSITSVEITEFSRKKKAAYGENIYDENNFEPDYEITGPMTLNLRSERTGASTGRAYIVTVTVTECEGGNTYTFTAAVEVPHDQGQ